VAAVLRGISVEFASYEASTDTRLVLSQKQYLTTTHSITARGYHPAHVVHATTAP
jgi:hypothetical protein